MKQSIDIKQIRWSQAVPVLPIIVGFGSIPAVFARALSGSALFKVTTDEWVAATLAVTLGLVAVSAAFRFHYRVCWSDDELEVYRRKRGEFIKWDRIREIGEDQIAFHLFSIDDQLIIKKKTAPASLLLKLRASHDAKHSMS